MRDVLLTVMFVLALLSQARAAGPDATASAGVSVRITSPLGRTGTFGAIRIVAQIRTEDGTLPGPVRFAVDGRLLATDSDGPPYVAEWVDENPFERREITVDVTDALGREARDRVVLEPFDVIEEAQVTSVLLEASVQDKQGRPIKGIPLTQFTVLEDGVPQHLDLAQQEAVGVTFALLIDSSRSMSQRLGFVQRTAATLADYMSPLDRMIVAPFSNGVGAVTGPTDDRKTLHEAIGSVVPTGGTAILDSLAELSNTLAKVDGRRAIVLITDGYDEHSTRSIDDALAAAKAAHTTVYVIGIGGVAGVSFKGEQMLRRIAAETGGRAFFPATDGQLEIVRVTLADDVRYRYVFAYTPSNEKADGSWRAITLRCGVPEYAVRTRPGYFAPKPSPIKPTLEFTARDPMGRYLDVAAEDLEVVENGVPQHVELFHEASQPLSLVLTLDGSGSMKTREADVIESARAFVSALRPEDALAVVLFSDTVTFAHDLSTNRNLSHDAIQKYEARGGTALFDAVSDSLRRLRDAGGRRVLVVMTDGRDENNPGTGPGSTRTLNDAVKDLKESGATVFTIGLGTKIDASSLQQLATLSGGRALFPQDVSQLGVEFQRVVEDLRRRYIVGFTSSHVAHDGAWREVQIRLRSAPEVTIQSSGGYNAPAK
jgi:Ca-activated chloride channel family protein